MRLRTFESLMGILLITAASVVVAAGSFGGQHSAAPKANADAITGDWAVTFELQGTKVPASFRLKLDGDKVTGTADSHHTGAGTLSKGSWLDNRLDLTIDFAAHESIVVTGKIENGKLVGEFATEGMRGTWTAEKK
jgi:hypothetical protein